MKLEVLFEVTKRLAESHDALRNLETVLVHESLKEQAKCQQAWADFDKANAL